MRFHRFERWCKAMTVSLIDECRPPVDVIMVIHAYLLNPGCVLCLLHGQLLCLIMQQYSWYAEDRFRLPILQNLVQLNEMFEVSLVRLLDDHRT